MTESSTYMLAYNPLKSVLGISIIDVVVPVTTPTLEPVNLTLPTELVLIPTKSVLKSILRTFISWSLLKLNFFDT